jgi:hypothetical protein
MVGVCMCVLMWVGGKGGGGGGQALAGTRQGGLCSGGSQVHASTVSTRGRHRKRTGLHPTFSPSTLSVRGPWCRASKGRISMAAAWNMVTRGSGWWVPVFDASITFTSARRLPSVGVGHQEVGCGRCA